MPEAATLTMTGGGMIVLAGASNDYIIRFQVLLMKTMIFLEDYFYQLAILAD